jgi:hypothetical protein
MIRLLASIPLLLALASAAAQAPDAPPARSGEPQAPKRQITFETSDKEMPLPLFAADPKLLERRYVAEVKLSVPGYDALPRPIGAKLFNLYRSLPDGNDISSLLSMIRQSPMPPGEAVQLLAAEARFVLRDPMDPISRNKADANQVAFRVLSTTPEQAKDLTKALLALFEQEITEPIQEYLQERKRVEEAALRGHRERFAAAKQQADALKPQVSNEEVMDAKAIIDLKTQRRLLEVDLAGVKARVDACEAILQRRLSDARREQVENVKITAEIDLAGLAARQKTLDAIIAEGMKALTVKSELGRAQSEVSGWQNRIAESEQKLAEYVRLIEMYGPFRLVDDKVVIRPIKWEAKTADK